MSAPEPTTLAGAPIKAFPNETLDLAVAVTHETTRPMTAPQAEVLRKAVCPNLSDTQFLLYVTWCARKGLDPFLDAYAFPQANGGLALGMRIDGMRALARRAGPYSRKIDLIFAPDDAKAVIGARCAIHRVGDPEPFVSEVLLKEYAKGGNWNTMPEVMIKKVAEATALRAAFGDALGGLYEPAEVE